MKSSTTNVQESEVLIAAIERVLRQLTKMLIGRMAFPKFVELARKVFIEEAENNLKRESKGKSVSLTDLGLVTGIDTRTITKVRDSSDYERPISESKSFFAHLIPEAIIVDKWQSDSEFTDEHGNPARLKIWGEHNSFESLVQSTVKSRGITVKSILNRLVDSKSTTISKDSKYVELHPELWMHYQSTDAEGLVKAGLLAVSQHLNTVVNNVDSNTGDVRPKFERIFYCNRIDPTKLGEFREKLEEYLESTSNGAVEVMKPYDKDFNLYETVSGGVGFYYFDTENS